MAYYQGETLKGRIERGALPIGEVASIAGHITDGLAAAHAAGVIHRDLKPANVFLTSSGQVKILDFGLAKVETAMADTTSGITQAGTTLGTLSYMSPEQARGAHVDQRADVWALGVLIFEMCTGRQPFRGSTATAILLALTTEAVPLLQSLRRDAPEEFAKLVERALVKDPERRTLTAAEAAHAIAVYRDRTATPAAPSWWRVFRRPVVAIPAAAAVVAVVVGAVLLGTKLVNQRWANNTALPEITRLADRQDFIAAVDLAKKAEPFLRGDADLAVLWPRISRTVTLESDPPGTHVSYTRYGTSEPWRVVGLTPLKGVRLPAGLLRFKAEKPGFDPAEDVLTGGVPSFALTESGKTPEGMVRAAPVRGPFSIYVFGLETPRVRLDGFWIDRYEVTNRQFKAFVDAGGYKRRDWWSQPFVKDGKTLTFDQAVSSFVDATGRPGPATWELGSYPAGTAELPVTGVSWYEAAAYAAFKGRALPTAFHWYWVASQAITGFVIPLGNFNSAAPYLPPKPGRSTASAPTGWPVTSRSGRSTKPPAIVGTRWVAGGTNRRTCSATPMPGRPSTAAGLWGSAP